MDQMRAILGSRLDANTWLLLSTMAVAFVIAEQLYKFRSFTLEAVAFLITWWAIRRVALFFYKPDQP